MIKNSCIKAHIVLCLIIFILSAESCTRNSGEKPVDAIVPAYRLGAWPLAILKTGEQPLWFRLTEEGPVLLESIDDAINTAAFIPWPLALHVRFFLERGEELLLVINRDGFMRFAPYYDNVTGIAMYRFTGGEFWRQYTAGGFVFYDDKPAAVLYLDDRFLDSSHPLPRPRAWTFNMESNWPFPLDIPALRHFPPEEGWDVDTLRSGGDGFIYYRAARRNVSRPEVKMLRTNNLSQPGKDVSLEAFQNSAPREIELSHPLLPPLPKGFFYTGIGYAGDSLFASWEEQEDFNIGAAGFVMIKK
jgi:hypothetical protein